MRIQDYLQETPEKMVEMIKNSDKLFSEVKKVKIDRIVITGSGTSYHSGLQMQPYIQQVTGIRTDVYYPFQVNKDSFIGDSSGTLLVGISQGGSSYSTYNAMKSGKEAGCKIASMAGVEDALIDETADFVLTVHCGDETVGPKTKGYFCTKLNLALLALYLAKGREKLSEEAFINKIGELKKMADTFLERYHASVKWVDRNKDKLAAAKEIRVIGTREIYGDTLESALKLLESLRIPVTGYEFEEFVHGIYNAINENSSIIILDPGTEKRVGKMIHILSEWTSDIYVIGKYKTANPQNLHIEYNAQTPFETFDCILPVQLICAEVPPLKGVNPHIPKDPQFHKKLGSKRIID